jgi:RimJ/RimL family protein N-acetyltransferase
MKVPVVETPRLILREWRNEDLDAYTSFRGDAGLSEFIGGVQDRNQSWRTIAYLAGHWLLRGFGFWSVIEKSSGSSVGYCGPYFPEGWPEREIGWGTYPGHGGKGYATEAASAALDYAYRRLGWTTAISLIDDRNEASKAVARKIGATPEYPFPYRGSACTVFRHLAPEKFQSQFKGEMKWL